MKRNELLKIVIEETDDVIDNHLISLLEETDIIHDYVDSLEFVELIMKLEKRLEIGIPEGEDDELSEIYENKTFGDLVNYVLPLISFDK